jgi:hypothetical protein
MSDPGVMREKRKVQKTSLDAQSQQVMLELVSLGFNKEQARAIVIRLWNRCGERGISVIQLYLDHGWTPPEIVEHSRQNEQIWRRTPEVVFQSEQNLIDAGLSSELARRAIILHPCTTLFERDAVLTAIATYREVGLGDADFRYLALKHPRALIANPEVIRAWRIVHGSVHRGITSVHALTSGRLTKDMQAYAPMLPPPPPMNVDPADQDISDAPTDAMEDEDEGEHSRNWQKCVACILNITAPLDEPEPEKARIDELSWIWDGTTQAKAVLDELATWTGLTRNISASSADTKTLRFFSRILLESKLHPCLRLDPEVARYRLHVLRRFILNDRDVVDAPSFLLLPWENLPEREIRYRINALSDTRLVLANRDVLRALLEPKRETFHRKIEELKKFF